MAIYSNTTLEALNLQLGQNGFDLLSKLEGANFHEGKWCAIFNPDDEEISVTAKDKNSITTLSAIKLCPRGTLYGEFNFIRHTASGKNLITYRIPKLS